MEVSRIPIDGRGGTAWCESCFSSWPKAVVIRITRRWQRTRLGDSASICDRCRSDLAAALSKARDQ